MFDIIFKRTLRLVQLIYPNMSDNPYAEDDESRSYYLNVNAFQMKDNTYQKHYKNSVKIYKDGRVFVDSIEGTGSLN
jgi:hypothetical protein